MSTRPYLCPHCRATIGVLQDWQFRGQRHTRLKVGCAIVETRRTPTGWQLKCTCGQWCRASASVRLQLS